MRRMFTTESSLCPVPRSVHNHVEVSFDGDAGEILVHLNSGGERTVVRVTTTDEMTTAAYRH